MGVLAATTITHTTNKHIYTIFFKRKSELAWDVVSSEFINSGTTYANIVCSGTESVNSGTYMINVPDDLPTGLYDAVIYETLGALPAVGDIKIRALEVANVIGKGFVDESGINEFL